VRRPHRRVAGDVREAVVQSRRAVDRIEVRNEIHEAGERRQAPEPALAAARDSEVEAGAKDFASARVALQQRNRRLRDDERDVALEPVVQPLALMCDGVLARTQVDEDGVTVDRDRESAQLVGELIERPAGPQVEACVMPVAGQDAVAHRAAVQREAHVRAAVVDRVHLVAVREETDGVPVQVHDEPPRRAHLVERRGVDQTFACNGRHAHSLKPQVRLKSSGE
jgi:hypothetical protein